MITLPDQIPEDSYTDSFGTVGAAIPSTDRTGPEIDRFAKILWPRGGERILDLACGSGRRSLELRRRGFEVIARPTSRRPQPLSTAKHPHRARATSAALLDPASLMIGLGEVLENIDRIEFSQRLYGIHAPGDLLRPGRHRGAETDQRGTL